MLATKNQPPVFLVLLVVDLLVNFAASKQQLEEHFDRMRVQPAVRKAILPVKIAGTLGVLLGRRWPRLGALTAACFVVYFVIAFGYHRRVDDGAFVTAPSVIYGGVALRTLAADLAASR
jgi:hypothetical protein